MASYSRLTDDELLRYVDEKRQHSPLIEELCKRLEHKHIVFSDANHRVECPVCEAALEADYDEGNGMFELRIEK